MLSDAQSDAQSDARWCRYKSTPDCVTISVRISTTVAIQKQPKPPTNNQVEWHIKTGSNLIDQLSRIVANRKPMRVDR